MSPRRKAAAKPKAWWFTATAGPADAPVTVTVHERTPGGVLYERIFDPTATRKVKGKTYQGAQRRRSLGHRDRVRAQEYALEQAKKLAAGVAALQPRPTIGYVIGRYLALRTPQKKNAQQRADDRRRASLWIRRLGSDRLIETLGKQEWQSFIAERLSGAINGRGEPVPEEKDPETGEPRRVPIGPRTADADLVFLNAVFNWAIDWKVDGQPLIARNPWGATGSGVKRALARPTNPTPRRPIITQDEFERVRAAAAGLWMESKKGEPGAVLREAGVGHFGPKKSAGPVMRWMAPSYLPDILDLLEQTGRRVGEVLRLQADDLRWNGGEIVAIRWRPFKKREGRQRAVIVPVAPATQATLRALLDRRPRIGAVPLFPSPRHPERPITRRLATEWYDKAKAAAGLGALVGCFHAYRRKWATERKHRSPRDVMEVGGWDDPRSLEMAYIQPDEDTMLEVVNEPTKLRRRRLAQEG